MKDNGLNAKNRGLYRIFRYGLFAIVGCLSIMGSPGLAEDVIEPPDQFIARTFDPDPPAPKALWLTPDLQEDIQHILGHKMQRLRLRYWQEKGKTAWILEDIGKEQPITAGFVVGQDGIESVHLLIYRESRGWEIRYPYFRRQFKSAQLQENLRLDTPIDGISGATLSVHAMERMTRLALLFHQAVTGTESPAP